MNYLPSHLKTKEVKKDKEALIQDGYNTGAVMLFVKKHLDVPAYREALQGKENLYLVMPSTSGYNTIPEFIAARLQKEYGGEIVVDYALPMHKTKSAYMGAVSKMKEPREYIIRKEPFSKLEIMRKNVVIVDDVVTSGTSVHSLSQSLLKAGVVVDGVVSVAQSDKRLVSERDIQRLSEKLLPSGGDIESVRKDVELVFSGRLKHAINTVEREVTGPAKVKYKEYAYEHIKGEAARIRSEASLGRGLQPGQGHKAAIYPRRNDRGAEMAVGEKQGAYGRNQERDMVDGSVADLKWIARQNGFNMNASVVAAVADEMSSGRSNFEELRAAMMVKIDQMKTNEAEKHSEKSRDEGLSL